MPAFFVMVLILLCACVPAPPQQMPMNQRPMYGGAQKTDALLAADKTFIDSVVAKYGSREAGAKRWVEYGWDAFHKKDLATAIMRFNQAWLLDTENGDAYYGFALVTFERKGLPADVEKYFQMSLSKANVSLLSHVDYGRFLWVQKRLDESLAKLHETLDMAPTLYRIHGHISFVHYLKRNFAEACKWGTIAEDNGEKLEPGFVKEMCQRAKGRT